MKFFKFDRVANKGFLMAIGNNDHGLSYGTYLSAIRASRFKELVDRGDLISNIGTMSD